MEIEANPPENKDVSIREIIKRRLYHYIEVDSIIAATKFMKRPGIDVLFAYLEQRGLNDKWLLEKYCKSRRLEIVKHKDEFYCCRIKDQDNESPVYGIGDSIFDSICALHIDLECIPEEDTFLKTRLI